VIEIQHQYRDAVASGDAIDGDIEPIVQQGSIGQAGQEIVMCDVTGVILTKAALGDVVGYAQVP
jgi:hypothetical protein